METIRRYQHILPADVLLNVFAYLDVDDLVFNCRRVCKFWKRTVESSNVWKIQISRLAVKNKEVERILPTAHNVYPWYVCYALCKNIFGTNLIVGNVPEILTGSAFSVLTWDSIMLVHMFISTVFPFWMTNTSRNAYATSSVLNFSGRIVYFSAIGAYITGFSIPPQELLDEEANFCLFAAVGYSGVVYTIDLYARGFTKKIFELNPAIVIYVWFTVRQEFYSRQSLKVTLLNSHREVDEEDGMFHYDIVTDTTEWGSVTFAFTDYRSDVRYVTFENSIDITFPRSMELDKKYLLLELGAKVTAAKIVVKLPNL